MRLLLTIGLLTVALVLAGCNKGDEDSETQAGSDKGNREPVTTAARDTSAGEPAVTSAEETSLVISRLAPEFGLLCDSEAGVITGEGFPEQGVPTGVIVDKVAKSLSGTGNVTTAMREDAVRTVLSQLAAVGQASANQQAAPPASAAGAPDGIAPDASGTSENESAPPELNYHPTPEEMLSPKVIYGDWHSIREDHANATVEHNDDYYESVQFRYGENIAVFHLFRDGKLVSNTEFPYSYDPRAGIVTLYGPDRQPMQTMTVSATHPDPYLLWVQRDGSRTKTLYEKKGRGGEPVTLEDEIEGIRILKGDEEAENYRRQKEKERREGSG